MDVATSNTIVADRELLDKSIPNSFSFLGRADAMCALMVNETKVYRVGPSLNKHLLSGRSKFVLK
jgi:hypothetical protein